MHIIEVAREANISLYSVSRVSENAFPHNNSFGYEEKTITTTPVFLVLGRGAKKRHVPRNQRSWTWFCLRIMCTFHAHGAITIVTIPHRYEIARSTSGLVFDVKCMVWAWFVAMLIWTDIMPNPYWIICASCSRYFSSRLGAIYILGGAMVFARLVGFWEGENLLCWAIVTVGGVGNPMEGLKIKRGA